MLKYLLCSTVLFVLCIAPLFAQLPKASEFLPLKVGNVWQHQRYDGLGVVIQSEVISDSLIGDTLRVYKLQFKAYQDPPTSGFGYRYYNLDSTAVYAGDLSVDPPFDFYASLNLLDTQDGFGGRWTGFFGDIALSMAITDTGRAFLFDEQRLWVEVNTIIEEADTFRIDETYHARHMTGIGLTRLGIDTLIYAKIDGKEFGTPVTSVRDNEYRNLSAPNDFRLQVYPNPARTQTTFYLEKMPKGQTEVVIYDILGRKIRQLQFNDYNNQTLTINWDGRDANNQAVVTGIYFVSIRAGHLIKTRKFIYLR